MNGLEATRKKFQDIIEKAPEYATVGFAINIRKFQGNPFHIDTPFGKPETIAVGNLFEKIDELEAKIAELEDALAQGGAGDAS